MEGVDIYRSYAKQRLECSAIADAPAGALIAL